VPYSLYRVYGLIRKTHLADHRNGLKGMCQNRIIFANTPLQSIHLIEPAILSSTYAGCTLEEIRGRLDKELKQLRSKMIRSDECSH